MTPEKLKKFFDERPNLKSEIARQAGISRWTIDRMIKGSVDTKQETVEKLGPVLKKFGYKGHIRYIERHWVNNEPDIDVGVISRKELNKKIEND